MIIRIQGVSHLRRRRRTATHTHPTGMKLVGKSGCSLLLLTLDYNPALLVLEKDPMSRIHTLRIGQSKLSHCGPLSWFPWMNLSSNPDMWREQRLSELSRHPFVRSWWPSDPDLLPVCCGDDTLELLLLLVRVIRMGLGHTPTSWMWRTDLRRHFTSDLLLWHLLLLLLLLLLQLFNLLLPLKQAPKMLFRFRIPLHSIRIVIRHWRLLLL